MLTIDRVQDDQDRRISEAIEREEARLRNFIRRRVPDRLDVEDVLQDVFSELGQWVRRHDRDDSRAREPTPRLSGTPGRHVESTAQPIS